MKTVIARCVVFAVAWLVMPGAASAQWVVTDPSGLVQSVQQTTQQIQMVRNQIRMIESTVKQVDYMRRNVESLDVNNLRDLEMAYYRLNGVYMQAKGIGWRYGAMVDRYERLYAPDDPDAPTAKTYHEKRAAWEAETDKSIKEAMRAHGVVDVYDERLTLADKLVAMSNSAEGQLQAIQVTNQLLSLMLRQLTELSYLVATDSRARLSALKEDQAKEVSARKQHRDRTFFKRTKRREGKKAPAELPRVE